MDKVLLVEDEVNIASFIKRGLEEFGYDVTVAYDGESGWNEIQNGVFNLLIFDIIMPKISGLELCQRYREQFGYTTPVLLLTALGTTQNIVDGLNAGADDYVVKPFSFKELQARIAALLRRGSNNGAVASEITYNDIVLNLSAHRAEREGVVIDLTVKECRLLEYFIHNHGVVLSREQLLKTCGTKTSTPTPTWLTCMSTTCATRSTRASATNTYALW